MLRLRPALKASIRSFDEILAKVCIPLVGESGTLLIFLFHGLFLSFKEARTGLSDPQQGITVDAFREFISYFDKHGYQFVSPLDILKGLNPKTRNLLITFDDGYYNNVRAVPVLEEFRAPAVFFVSTDHVKYGKSFWWDVVFREWSRRGRTDVEICQAISSYKRFTTDAVEKELCRQFGEHVLNPASDLDRPFTPAELKALGAHALCFIGNHTKDHAILTNYSSSEIVQQISVAQDDIREMTGKTPEIIAYPNGNESSAIRSVAWASGLRLGVGTLPGRNRLPLNIDRGKAMMLKRFTLWGNSEVGLQCLVGRSRLSLYRSVRHLSAQVNPGRSLAIGSL